MRIPISFLVVILADSQDALPFARLLWRLTRMLCEPQARTDRAHFQGVELAIAPFDK
jgi:hypothetical protein